MSTNEHKHSQDNQSIFWNYNNVLLHNNYTSIEQNIISEEINSISQLLTSPIFLQDNSNHFQYLNANVNQDCLDNFSDIFMDNIQNNESHMIDFNLFDIDNLSPNPFILPYINNYSKLPSLETDSGNDIIDNQTTTTIAHNNLNKATTISSLDFQFISTDNTITSIEDITMNTSALPVLSNTSLSSSSSSIADTILDMSSTLVVTPLSVSSISTNSTDPCLSITNSILEHNRPYFKYGHLNHEMIIRKARFDLIGTKTTEKRLLNNNRMSRQMYAITCQTNIPHEHIMNEICRQFPMKILQYTCISIDYSELMETFRTIYIQIILKRVVNKNGWFLDKVTGDQCNYHVTNNDMAWNEYIKKDRFSIEIGHFKSKVARSYNCCWSSNDFIRAQTKKQQLQYLNKN